ncbi:MAG: hypothetical protein FJ014_06925 [Chloroflexi bacterium]|nr:hypothetical protein [Chloroflexota bacterium]
MYSPKVPEEFVPRLWRLARERGIPMTHLVRDAVSQYLATQEGGKNHGQEQGDRGRGEDVHPDG